MILRGCLSDTKQAWFSYKVSALSWWE